MRIIIYYAYLNSLVSQQCQIFRQKKLTIFFFFGQDSKYFEYKIEHISKTIHRKNWNNVFHGFQNIAHILDQK